MNYDCQRPTSRVIRPPGGGSSNIFGVPEQAGSAQKSSTNPSFKSSVFDHGPQATNSTKPAAQKVASVSRTYISTVFQKEPKRKTKPPSPTFSSTIFVVNDENKSVRPSIATRPDTARKISNVPMFDSSGKRPTSAPCRPQRNNSQLNIFSCPNYPVKAKHEPGKKVFPKTVRRDPITGEEIGSGDKVQEKDKEAVEEKPSVVENGKQANGNEPHLGARNATGIRCAQPPGGRSTVTFG